MNVKDKTILSKCKIIIIKIMENGTIKECGPCVMCDNLLNKYKVKHIKSKLFC